MDDLYFDEPLTRSHAYTTIVPAGGWRRNFPAEYIRQIRPIAETLAMMNHDSPKSYKAYLQEADAVLRNERVHEDMPSWIKQYRLMQEDTVMAELWNKLQMLLALKEDKNGNV
jgi:hypothetical protein